MKFDERHAEPQVRERILGRERDLACEFANRRVEIEHTVEPHGERAQVVVRVPRARILRKRSLEPFPRARVLADVTICAAD